MSTIVFKLIGTFYSLGAPLVHAVYFSKIGSSDQNNLDEVRRLLHQFTTEISGHKNAKSFVVGWHDEPGFSHVHLVHACKSFELSSRKCQCFIGRGRYLLGWKRKRTNTIVYELQAVINLFLYLQGKAERGIYQIRIGADLFEPPANDSHDLEDLGSGYRIVPCESGCAEDRDDATATVIDKEPHVRVAKRSYESAESTSGETGTTTMEELKRLLKEKALQIKPTDKMDLINCAWFEENFPWWYVRLAKSKSVLETAWNSVVRDWLALSFDDVLTAQWENLTQFTGASHELYYDPYTSAEIVARLFIEQSGGSVDQAKKTLHQLYQILDKQLPKQNTFYIVSQPGAGKSFIFNSIKKLVWLSGTAHNNQKHNGNAFPFNDCRNQYIIEWNECFLEGQAFIDKCKEIWEGAHTRISVKYESNSVLKRTPLLVSSNKLAWLFAMSNDKAFRDRCFLHKWKPQPWLKTLRRQICPLAWYVIYKEKMDDNVWWSELPSTDQLEQFYCEETLRNTDPHEWQMECWIDEEIERRAKDEIMKLNL